MNNLIMNNNDNFGNNMIMKSNMGGNNNIELIFAVNGTEYRISTNKNMILSTLIRQIMNKNPELKKRNINNLLCNGRKLSNHQTIEENYLENNDKIFINDI